MIDEDVQEGILVQCDLLYVLKHRLRFTVVGPIIIRVIINKKMSRIRGIS